MNKGIGAVSGGVNKAKTFLKETRSELRKVVWPSKNYVISATIIIFIIVAVFGAFVMLLDSALSHVFSYLLKAF